ncbi:MAG TPA: amidohydrolase family protein [Dehalococcoidia bacterium]|nr:amidohydrolase family protein [Dehalococcoidia bacterium]
MPKSVISADSHMLEPGDLWVQRLPAQYRDRAPRVYFDEGTKSWLFGCEGIAPIPAAALFAAGKSDQELADHQKAGLDAARPGGWDPAERLKDMAIDHVEAEVLYTSLAFNLFWITDAQFQAACFRVYNDWLAEFCSYAPDRLVGLGLISCYDIDGAVAELRRIRNQGLKGAMIWCSPPEEMSYAGWYHDPFWAAAQDLDMPISLHILTGQAKASRGLAATATDNRFVRLSTSTYEIQQSLAEMIFTGVFERFPRLKIVSAENHIGWIPFFLQRADGSWTRFRYVEKSDLTMLPSEYFRRNIWATFIKDRAGLHSIDLIGADNIMWSSDYPHTASTWPRSLAVIEEEFAGIPEDVKAKVCRDNAAKLYDFDLATLAAKPLAGAVAD